MSASCCSVIPLMMQPLAVFAAALPPYQPGPFFDHGMSLVSKLCNDVQSPSIELLTVSNFSAWYPLLYRSIIILQLWHCFVYLHLFVLVVGIDLHRVEWNGHTIFLSISYSRRVSVSLFPILFMGYCSRCCCMFTGIGLCFIIIKRTSLHWMSLCYWSCCVLAPVLECRGLLLCWGWRRVLAFSFFRLSSPRAHPLTD